LPIEPDGFEYPLELTTTQNQSVTTLHWSEATVSTFEEYIILRSTMSIPDGPEPEVNSNTVIIGRVDQRKVTTFEDLNAPLSNTLYYKVYAKIAGRFLMSPTIAHDQNLSLIPMRADVSLPIQDQGLLLGYDRLTRTLFVYDYINRELLRSQIIQQLSVPILSMDPTTNEILIGENGTIYFYDFTTLELKQTFFPGLFRDLQSIEGWIYIQKASSPYGFALYRRSDLSFRKELTVLQADWRKFYIQVDPKSPFKATIYDFATTGSARYKQDGTNLTSDLTRFNTLPGSIVSIIRRPSHDEFVVNTSGSIVDVNLQQVDILENGQFSYSFYDYSPDGKNLFALTFLNSPVLRIYNAENEYNFRKEHPLSNQISPISLFTDANAVNVVSLAFADGSWKTLITSIGYE
jgi:hypothetical protein